MEDGGTALSHGHGGEKLQVAGWHGHEHHTQPASKRTTRHSEFSVSLRVWRAEKHCVRGRVGRTTTTETDIHGEARRCGEDQAEQRTPNNPNSNRLPPHISYLQGLCTCSHGHGHDDGLRLRPRTRTADCCYCGGCGHTAGLATAKWAE
jgi:hypothetical protein